MLEGSAPLLAIPPSPEEVDRMVTRHKPSKGPGASPSSKTGRS